MNHQRRSGVAILTLNRPMANVLAHSLRTDLQNALNSAVSDAEVSAIVLAASGADFSSGVDITDYDGPPKSPWTNDLCLQIEACPKPVVAALHGAVLGGGAELALAAHKRVAATGTRFGLPEVLLGLIPNGGATQRLPRMVGAQRALELMLSGREFGVEDPRLKNLVDAVVPEGVIEAAVETALELARAGKWTRTRDRIAGFSDPVAYQNAIREVRSKLRSSRSAEADIVTCVEAAQLLPYMRGLELEQVRFEDRRRTPDSRARRHFHTSERRTAIMPERARGRPADVQQVVIPGSGALVAELAIMCLDAGLNVSLMAEDVARTESVRARIEEIYNGAVDHHVLNAEARDALMARLTPAWPAEALPQADLVLDAGLVDLQVHHHALNPEAIWVSVASGQGMPTTAPRDIAARHLEVRVYRPVINTKMVELCVPPGATSDTVVTVAHLFNRMGRTVVRSECVEGLVGGNMSAAFFAAALALAKAGVGPYRIDAAARGLGFAHGPFLLMDEEGLPKVAARLQRRVEAGGEGDSDLLTPRIAAGATGRGAGRGFYIYDDGGAHPDPELKDGVGAAPVEAAVANPRAALEAALVNEAARLLGAQVVQRASDIDVIMVRGFGFDARRGGPLFQADVTGLLSILNDLKRLASVSASLWQPHEMIETMVKNGTGFFGRKS
ncbi:MULTISPECIES: enoyl-CoA hydratase-related protein [unclassified Roseovarius]|uniref:enoyl-CoA hydratase-related protein n=1 Tax=unclassified Roseovarius TaxID=2614913 RepID=UPI00273E1FE5|nr:MULTISPECIES: enoyl-CoA hydratase-related protein [unclassified Roseovarius]